MIKRITSSINENLLRYYKTTLEMAKIDPIVQELLPEPLKAHTKVSAFAKGVLILTTTNANFAYQLKFMLPNLREQLRKKAAIYAIASIKVQIGELPPKLSKESLDKKNTLPSKPKTLEEALSGLEKTLNKKGIYF